MRKISAHYYLRPDGKFGKRPIIELDSAGFINNIRELGDAFREEPGLEYFPGIIIPGFVASIGKADEYIIKKKALINGVLRIKEGETILENSEYHLAWSSIKRETTESLLNSLVKFTKDAAQQINEEKWGILKSGSNPGILVLHNIDLRTFTLTDKASFKIIQR
jgi:hypothetical protein